MKRSEKLLSGGEIIRQRREAALLREDLTALVLRILLIAAAAWLLFTQVFIITQAHGNGMFPAVKDGDLLIGYRLQQDYLKEDVVLFRQDGVERIGRIAGRAGDTVVMNDTGSLTVNGTPQPGEILYPTFSRDGEELKLLVPENTVYVLGDYRTQCLDSRDFGPVPMEAVTCKVITILRRRGL